VLGALVGLAGRHTQLASNSDSSGLYGWLPWDALCYHHAMGAGKGVTVPSVKACEEVDYKFH
jgi:hypothetical protein